MRYIFAVVVLMMCSASLGFGQQRIAEVKQKSAAIAAPRDCVAAFREFFSYVQKSEPSIVHDQQAQKRFLTENLRKALLEHAATLKKEAAEHHDFPGNGTFVGSWDYPTTYAIVASRRYGNRAVIDVLYKWGPNTNYPGDDRTTSFVYLLEDGMWKLDDIYTFRGEFVTAGSLNQYLRAKQ